MDNLPSYSLIIVTEIGGRVKKIALLKKNITMYALKI